MGFADVRYGYRKTLHAALQRKVLETGSAHDHVGVGELVYSEALAGRSRERRTRIDEQGSRIQSEVHLSPIWRYRLPSAGTRSTAMAPADKGIRRIHRCPEKVRPIGKRRG